MATGICWSKHTVKDLSATLPRHCGNEGVRCVDGLSASHLPGAP